MNDRAIPSEAATVSRRRLLAGALGGAAATTLPLATAGGAAAQQPSTPAPAPPADATRFFADPALNFQTLLALGAAGYGASELGEVLTVVNRVHERGDTYLAYFEEYAREGRRLRERADAARRRGHLVSARAAYLRAACYLNQALYFTLASSRPTRAHEAQVYREMEGAFARAAALFRPAWRPVRIPYGRTTLPGWFLKAPGADMRRPTVILTNGSDGQNIDMVVQGGAAALERGWNALIYEGPGQGANLFLRDMPFRPDWEKVVTPVVDFLRARPDVDRRRIVLAGVSFAGYLVPRAAAFEHRLAAVVADGGVTDAFVSWSNELPRDLLELLYAGRKAEFDGYWAEASRELPEKVRFDVAKRAEIYGRGTFFDQMTLASRFRLSPSVARRIRTPTAVLDAELEQFFPGQPRTLYDWLRAKPKALLRFTIAEGAQWHCEPMAPQVRNERVYDWLESNVR